MNYNIPLFDLSYNNLKIKDYILSVVERHIETSTFILGPDVKLFEEKFSESINCNYTIGVNSGTDAIKLSLRALNVHSGDDEISSKS